MKNLALVGLLLIWSFSAQSQWQEINKQSLVGIVKFDQDQIGNIYTATAGGDVNKYTAMGELLFQYSPTRTGLVHHVDATTQLRVLVFYEDLQEYVLLDRYLRSPVTYRLQDFGIGYISDIALNLQQNVWVVDQSDFTLKLLDPSRNMILEKVSLAKLLNQESAEIVTLRVHQNHLYLYDENKGLLVFDSIGNYQGALEVQGIPKFIKDELYYEKDDKLIIQNIYSEETRQFKLPINCREKNLYNLDRLVHISNQGFVIYKYLSKK